MRRCWIRGVWCASGGIGLRSFPEVHSARAASVVSPVLSTKRLLDTADSSPIVRYQRSRHFYDIDLGVRLSFFLYTIH